MELHSQTLTSPALWRRSGRRLCVHELRVYAFMQELIRLVALLYALCWGLFIMVIALCVMRYVGGSICRKIVFHGRRRPGRAPLEARFLLMRGIAGAIQCAIGSALKRSLNTTHPELAGREMIARKSLNEKGKVASRPAGTMHDGMGPTSFKFYKANKPLHKRINAALNATIDSRSRSRSHLV